VCLKCTKAGLGVFKGEIECLNLMTSVCENLPGKSGQIADICKVPHRGHDEKGNELLRQQQSNVLGAFSMRFGTRL
jgi:hypothetical protein